MDEIVIVRDNISLDELKRLAEATFGELVKAVVDVEGGIIAVGGEYHADAEAVLLEDGSKQANLWGFNIYPNQPREKWLEYHSLINIRPSQGNRSQVLRDANLQQLIAAIVEKLVDEQ